MRFLKDGPSIPDDLLIARDEGRVVFFCGAGVSYARAGLPDFFGLADEVIRKLGVPSDNPAYQVLNEVREMRNRKHISGLISADRIFGLLENDFYSHQIETAVAQALKPHVGVDLSAHKIMLDLATTPEGNIRLVTTNFDRLFEETSGLLRTWQPPNLPDPSHPTEMNGVIHIHGCVAKDYSGAEGEGFVLSSSDFGRAYLSDGWATQFVKEIIDRYFVVFVGYAADDPPVQYLLEALNRKHGGLNNVYAFQSGSTDEAIAKWSHKGVTAIPYIENQGHQALWETFKSWADRAKSPDNWYKTIIDLSQKGPSKLQPHERGQLAHIVSTLSGARKFSDSEVPPPAEWLFVFDPNYRYANKRKRFGETGISVDPFDLYGLDNDIIPEQIDIDNNYKNREIPTTAWNAFAANRLDKQNLKDENLTAFRGVWAKHSPKLPARLFEIGKWLAKVSDRPTSVWWASGQSGLHPDIQQLVSWQLERTPTAIAPVVRQAWRYLFESWNQDGEGFDLELYKLEAEITQDGWNSATIRKYAAILRPYFKIGRKYLSDPDIPEWRNVNQIQDLLEMDVKYPNPVSEVHIPDEWLSLVVRELRKNLELALSLENEIGGYGLININSLIPDSTSGTDHTNRMYGLSGNVISFSTLFERLIGFDVTLARNEFDAWILDDDAIFSRLRIWASGYSEVVPDKKFGIIISELSDNAFWGSYHQRDLLIVLAKRWKNLDKNARTIIEDRLLRGPTAWINEVESDFQERKAQAILNRLIWLKDNGCNYTFDLDIEVNKLQKIATDWKLDYAAQAAASMEVRSGWVRAETDYKSLLSKPISDLLSIALDLSGRSDDFLVENDPFAGLSAERPVLAFLALSNAAKRGEYPAWAWQTFLNDQARKSDKPKLTALIGERISRYPDDVVANIVNPISHWILNVGESLSSAFPKTFERTISKIVDVLELQLPGSQTAILRANNDPDWITEAINAPVGMVAQSLYSDSRTKKLESGRGFPSEWLKHVDKLLSFKGDFRRYALVIFAYNMRWFYEKDPSWTEANLLSVLDERNESDRAAIWSGFFWGSMHPPSHELYVRLKDKFISLAKQPNALRRKYGEILASILLAGWSSINSKTTKRYISNDELRGALLSTDEEFRSQILWRVRRLLQSKEYGMNKEWSKALPEFMREVWPHQKSVNTPKISANLCDLAFSSAERYPEVIDIILPFLTTVDRNHIWFPILDESETNIIDMFPKQTLALFDTVLPDDVTAWPYRIEAALNRIERADESLRSDGRLIELYRRWNAR